MSKLLESKYSWCKIPEDIPRKNLVFVTAKTTSITEHPEDPVYTRRLFDEEELKESARSLARRQIGINHIPETVLPKPYQVIDAQYNSETKSVEALLYLPDEYIQKIKEGKIKHVSVEYYWRDEERLPEGVKFKGLVFDRVDLLEGMNPGDKNTEIKLLESKKVLMEGELEIMDETKLYESEAQQYSELPSLEEIIVTTFRKLGEPLGPYKDFDDCVTSVKREKGLSDERARKYCGYLYWKIEKKRKNVGEEAKVDVPETESVELPKDTVATTAQEPATPVNVEPEDKQVPEVSSNPLNIGPMQAPVTPEQVEEQKEVMLGKAIQPEPDLSKLIPAPTEEKKKESVMSENVTTEQKPQDQKVEQKPVESKPEDKIKELQEAVDRLQKSLKETQESVDKKVKEAIEKARKEEQEKIREQLKRKYLSGLYSHNKVVEAIEEY